LEEFKFDLNRFGITTNLHEVQFNFIALFQLDLVLGVYIKLEEFKFDTNGLSITPYVLEVQT